MKRVFLDTNILLDFYLNRPGADAAEEVFVKANSGKILLFTSTLTFANFAYIVKREHTKEELYDILNEIEKWVAALVMDRRQLRSAINHPSKDFEDMLQYQCAIAGGCDLIITNNKKDFKDYSKLPLYTAEEYLKSFFK